MKWFLIPEQNQLFCCFYLVKRSRDHAEEQKGYQHHHAKFTNKKQTNENVMKVVQGLALGGLFSKIKENREN